MRGRGQGCARRTRARAQGWRGAAAAAERGARAGGRRARSGQGGGHQGGLNGLPRARSAAVRSRIPSLALCTSPHPTPPPTAVAPNARPRPAARGPAGEGARRVRVAAVGRGAAQEHAAAHARAGGSPLGARPCAGAAHRRVGAQPVPEGAPEAPRARAVRGQGQHHVWRRGPSGRRAWRRRGVHVDPRTWGRRGGAPGPARPLAERQPGGAASLTGRAATSGQRLA